MAPGGQCIACFLITLVTHRYFMHRLIFYIDGRLATDSEINKVTIMLDDDSTSWIP